MGINCIPFGIACDASLGDMSADGVSGCGDGSADMSFAGDALGSAGLGKGADFGTVLDDCDGGGFGTGMSAVFSSVLVLILVVTPAMCAAASGPGRKINLTTHLFRARRNAFCRMALLQTCLQPLSSSISLCINSFITLRSSALPCLLTSAHASDAG